jgi:hypothetical protein
VPETSHMCGIPSALRLEHIVFSRACGRSPQCEINHHHRLKLNICARKAGCHSFPHASRVWRSWVEVWQVASSEEEVRISDVSGGAPCGPPSGAVTPPPPPQNRPGPPRAPRRPLSSRSGPRTFAHLSRLCEIWAVHSYVRWQAAAAIHTLSRETHLLCVHYDSNVLPTQYRLCWLPGVR